MLFAFWCIVIGKSIGWKFSSSLAWAEMKLDKENADFLSCLIWWLVEWVSHGRKNGKIQVYEENCKVFRFVAINECATPFLKMDKVPEEDSGRRLAGKSGSRRDSAAAVFWWIVLLVWYHTQHWTRAHQHSDTSDGLFGPEVGWRRTWEWVYPHSFFSHHIQGHLTIGRICIRNTQYLTFFIQNNLGWFVKTTNLLVSQLTI